MKTQQVEYPLKPFNPYRVRSLRTSIKILEKEAAECTTEAAYKCVLQTIAVMREQLTEAFNGFPVPRR